MRKKLLILISILLINFSLAGCGNKSTESNNDKSSNATTENSDSTADNSNNNTEDVNKNDETSLPIKNENTTDSKEVKKKSCRFFYYHIDDNKYYYIDKDIEVVDNALVSSLTKELQNNNNNSKLVTLGKVNPTSATLDKQNDILKVYFNDDFKKATRLGTAAEVGLVTSIVNTYGYNFGVSKVAIYVNGKPHEDQRGAMGDYYTVDTSKATKL